MTEQALQPISAHALRERAYRVLRDADAPRSLTGKRLSGTNARRRLQARRRANLIAACLGPATYGFWVTQRPQTPDYTQAFIALKDAMRVVVSQCAIPPEAHRRSYADNRTTGLP